MTVPEAWEIAERLLVLCAAIGVTSVGAGALVAWLVMENDDARTRR